MKYDDTVINIFGLGRTRGEVGIEIEMEGNNLIRGRVPPYWLFHNDGSLRGPENAEYVLEVPVPREAVPAALSGLFQALKQQGAKIRKDSPNTSVHVHLNVQEWSLRKVYNLIVLWYIMEHVLTEWCGKDRIGNMFCLRGSDAELQIQRLASAMRYSRYQDIGDQDGLRYSALNYTSLAKFGSLEFRSLAGVYEPDIIQTWVALLLAMKDYAEKFETPPQLIQEFSNLGPNEFLKAVLPNNLWKHVVTKDSDKKLHFGMRFVQHVAYCINWEAPVKKKKEPVENWGEENPEIIQVAPRRRPINPRDIRFDDNPDVNQRMVRDHEIPLVQGHEAREFNLEQHGIWQGRDGQVHVDPVSMTAYRMVNEQWVMIRQHRGVDAEIRQREENRNRAVMHDAMEMQRRGGEAVQAQAVPAHEPPQDRIVDPADPWQNLQWNPQPRNVEPGAVNLNWVQDIQINN